MFRGEPRDSSLRRGHKGMHSFQEVIKLQNIYCALLNNVIIIFFRAQAGPQSDSTLPSQSQASFRVIFLITKLCCLIKRKEGKKGFPTATITIVLERSENLRLGVINGEVEWDQKLRHELKVEKFDCETDTLGHNKAPISAATDLVFRKLRKLIQRKSTSWAKTVKSLCAINFSTLSAWKSVSLRPWLDSASALARVFAFEIMKVCCERMHHRWDVSSANRVKNIKDRVTGAPIRWGFDEISLCWHTTSPP